jgi:hypothetical protein
MSTERYANGNGVWLPSAGVHINRGPAEYVLSLATGRSRLGEWCEKHALPHLIVTDVYGLGNDGPGPIGQFKECDD